MTTKRRVLISCSMMEDEIRPILAHLTAPLPVIWMDRGLHNSPEKLREELQKQIDSLQDYAEILMAFGLCGNGTEGLRSPRARLVLPKFDDCVNLMLCTGKRMTRGLTRPDSIYLTRGWTQDEESILRQYEELSEKYDEETRDAVWEMMYAHYRAITVIDTGCYDIRPVLEYAEHAGELMGLETDTAAGSNRILKQLIQGDWDDNFIILEPGCELSSEHFQVE